MAVSPTPPSISVLPPAPLPTDAEAVFDAKAGARLTAEEVMVTEQNAALAWQAGSMADTKDYRDAAATSAGNAADSATLAGEKVALAADQVALAADQVALAETQANDALASANSAQVSAAAAGAAAGLPSLIGNAGNALTVKLDETGVEFKALGQAIGDILVTARTPDATYLPADGSAYLQSTWPELFAVIGAAVKTAPVTKLANPATLPTGLGYGVSFSSDGVYMAVSHQSAPYITIYKRSGDVFTKLANPATLPAASSVAYSVAFSPDGIYMTVGYDASPYITIYKRSGDVFTKLANPAILPAGQALGVAFSADGIYLAAVNTSTPSVTIYKRSGDVFTKLADPATLPTGTARGVAFSADGIYMAVAHGTAPYITIYKRSGDVFTKLANPATLPTGPGYGVSFSSDGVYMSVAHNITPFVALYKRSGDVFTKLADPATLPAGEGYSVALYQSGAPYMGDFMVVGHGGYPYITIYRDGYPFDPYTQFQLPVEAANGTTPQTNIDTTFPVPKLTPYIKAKVNP